MPSISSVAAPVIPKGTEIYDTIMGAIEPELAAAALEHIDEKYHDETPEQARTRAKRYRAAFTEYKKRFAAYVRELRQSVQAYRRDALTSVESKAKSREVDTLSSLEAAMSTV